MNNYDEFKQEQYTPGFETKTESEDFEPGLNEDIVRRLSAIKQEPQWALDFRLKAWDHLQKIKEPEWANLSYNKID